MSRVLIPLAEGCEELEAVTLIDILRRAEIEVVTAGLADGPVKASRGVTLVPDTTLEAALASDDYDMVVLPGGMPGALHLAEDARLLELLRKMAASGKTAGAICAAPRVLAMAGLLRGRRATAYPGFIDTGDFEDITYTGVPVEIDGNIMTSRGPGTAMDFALAIVERLSGPECRENTEAALLRP
jgi:protein deglycase